MSEGNEQAAGQRWTSEFYKDARGKSPVETWLDDLGPQEFAALQAAIFHVLEPHGIGLGGTEWLKALGQGLFEFRVRHDEAEILSAHAEAGTPLPDSSP